MKTNADIRSLVKKSIREVLSESWDLDKHEADEIRRLSMSSPSASEDALDGLRDLEGAFQEWCGKNQPVSLDKNLDIAITGVFDSFAKLYQAIGSADLNNNPHGVRPRR